MRSSQHSVNAHALCFLNALLLLLRIDFAILQRGVLQQIKFSGL